MRIKSVKELPDWFDLEKYKDVKNLDASGWYEQLVIRADLKSLITLQQGLNGDEEEFIEPILTEVRTNPIINIESNRLLYDFFNAGILAELQSKSIRYSAGVHQITLNQLYIIEANIESDKREIARAFFRYPLDAERRQMSREKPRFMSWFKDPVDNYIKPIEGGEVFDSKVHLSIDLNVPNKALIDQFTDLLNKLRESSNLNHSSIQKPIFRTWINRQILPYLDLQLWKLQFGHEISNCIIADAIFPYGEGSEDDVKKTTSKLANELISDEKLVMLADLAAREISDNNN